MKYVHLLLFSILFVSTSRAETIIRFKDIRYMQLGQDLTKKADPEVFLTNGNGTHYAVIISGATCGIKVSVSSQPSMGGVYIHDQHVDLLDGELTEQDGVLFICSTKAPPQAQQSQRD